jgi:uncharacterized protein (DUF2267 family)
MSKLFISHSSANNAAALAIANWLTDAGWAEYFLDITPTRGLAPGERWQEALKTAADRCEAVLFLISPAWQASRWCLAEFLLAKQIGKTIFGVLVEATPLDALPKEMTAEWQLCDLVTGTARQVFRVSQPPIVPETAVSFAEDGLMRLRIGLQRAGLDPANFAWPPPSDPNRPPYRGLKALEPEDAAIFFGRESAIVRGLDALRGLRERGVERLFVILGASGAGKSSYLRAGLWPRLVRDDTRFLPLPVVRPERAVISGATGLTASLEAAFRERKAGRSRAVINQSLQAPGGFDRLLAELQTLARSRLEPDASPPTVVISIDQGEELFGAEGGAESARFLDLLAQTLASSAGDGAVGSAARQRSLTIIAIRSDSYERLQTEPRLAQVAPYLFSLPPIARAEFKTVVEGPAQRHTEAGHTLVVDPALTERLVDETEGADALPLLAFTLERLFVEHGGDGKLLLDDYEALGGVRGSIEAAIAAAFAEPGRAPMVPADRVARERLLRAGFIPWLARVDPNTEERKRRVARWEEIPPEVQPLLERLIEQRLLVRDRRKLEGREDVIVIEVAHEALLRQWPTLTNWLDEDAHALKSFDTVQRAAGEWIKNRGAASAGYAWLVHTGERLEAAEALRQRPDFVRLLGADGHSYLDACRGRDDQVRKEREERAEAERIARERELEQALALAEEQRRRADEQAAARIRQRRLSWLFGMAAVAAVVMMGYAIYQKGVAARQLAHANDALALGIWSDLDPPGDAPLNPQYRNALWRLACDRAGARDAFVKHLADDAVNQLRFGAMAPPIVRSLGFDRHGSVENSAILSAVVKAIPGTNDLAQVHSLAQAASGLAGKLTSAQAQVAFEAILTVIKDRKEDSGVQALARALPIIASKLGPENAQPVLTALLRANRDKEGEYPDQRQALAQAVPMVAARLTPDQAEAALGPVFALFREADDDNRLQALAQAVQLLARHVSTAQAQSVLAELLDMMRDTRLYSQSYFFAQVAPSLVERLAPKSALALLPAALSAFRNGYASDAAPSLELAMQRFTDKLAPDLASVAQGPVVDAMLTTANPFERPVLAKTLRTLHATLAPEQVQAVLASTLGRMQTAGQEPRTLRALARTLEALSAPLTRAQGQTALEPILEVLQTTKTPWWGVQVLAQAVQALPVTLTHEQAQAVLEPILDMLQTTKDPSEVLRLAQAVQALPVTLTHEQGQAVLEPILDMLQTTKDPREVQMLAQAVQALPVMLAKKQAETVLGWLLRAIVDATDHDTLRALVQSVPTFADKLTPEDAEEAAAEFLEEPSTDASALRDQIKVQASRALTSRVSPETVRVFVGQFQHWSRDTLAQLCPPQWLGQWVQVLADKFTPAQAGAMLTRVMGCIAAAKEPPALRDLAAAATALATQVTADEALTALAPVQLALAWAGSDEEATAWASAYAELLLRTSGSGRVHQLVEVLKYPMAGGTATEVLLAALQRIDPNSPGKDAGLDTNLDWLRQTYPMLNLDAAPTCPEPPPNRGLSCPKS